MIGLILALAVNVSSVEVTGADSVRVNGREYALYDVDAPQVRAQCRRERERAAETAAYVRTLMANAEHIEINPGYDPRGRRSWPSDRFGRRLADIRIDGRDLGDLLMAQGRAVRWDNAGTHNWCRR